MKLISLLLLASGLFGQTFPFPGPKNGGTSASYSGPGDVITSGVVAWWGLRAYSAATAGSKAANVCLPSDTACADFSTNSSGDLVITTISGTSCAAVTCTVKTLYDQTVGGLCSGPCDVTNSTIADRPTLVVSCQNSQPCLQFASGQYLQAAAATASSYSQPVTGSTVAERTGSFTSYGTPLGAYNGEPQIVFNNSANSITAYAGALVPAVAAADSSPHAIQALFNGFSSYLYVDGSAGTTGNGDVNGISTQFSLGETGGNNQLIGYFMEGGWWGADKSGSFSTLNANQRAFWGF